MCKSPLFAYQYFPLFAEDKNGEQFFITENKKLHFLHNCDYEKFNLLKSENTVPGLIYRQVNCGQCIECRINKSREWASRIVCEQVTSNNSLFVTLTYSDDHLPMGSKFLPSLVPDHIKKFFKDLRRYCQYHFAYDGIRHYTAGEYGSISARPHYHSCIFNLPDEIIAQNVPYKCSFQGDIYYNNPILEKIWNKGFVVIGDLNFQSAAYVARYVVKKMRGAMKSKYDILGIEPEFSRESTRPGIGKVFYDLHKDQIYAFDKVYAPGIPGMKPSAYFDKKYALDEPEVMEIIKAERSLSADRALKYKLSHTDKKYEEILEDERRDLEARIKRLVRPID